jgi:hypothetical protein
MLRPGAVADDGSTPAAAQEAQQQQTVSQQEQMQQLLEMFEGAADRSLVSDVYHASGCNMEAAADALFGLLGGAGGGMEPAGKLCTEQSQPIGRMHCQSLGILLICRALGTGCAWVYSNWF